MKIKGLLHIYTAARDRNGNCYHAAIYTDTETGASVRFGNIGGPNNMNGLGQMLGHPMESIHVSQEVMAIREWNRFTKGWPYISNHADEKAAEAVRQAIEACD